MTTQIMIKGNPVLGINGGSGESLSASMVVQAGTEPTPNLLEIELRSQCGTKGTVRLSIDEAETFALVIRRIVDDFHDLRPAEAVEWDGNSITRDALIKKLLSLPPNAIVGLRLFRETVGLSDLSPEKNSNGLYPLIPVAEDLEDVLQDWGFTPQQMQWAVQRPE